MNRAIEKATQLKAHIARAYGVDTTSVVWMGNNRFIVVKNGEEIKVQADIITTIKEL